MSRNRYSTELGKGLTALRMGQYHAAHKILLPMAENGVAEAQCAVASMYQCELGVSRCIVLAQRWYEKASAQGHGLASHNLGTIAVEQGDLGAARRWYELAKAQGCDEMSDEYKKLLLTKLGP